MVSYLKKTFVLVLLSIMAFSCKSIVDPPEKEMAVYGKIVDQNNNALSGVNVHYIYSLGEDVELRNAVISYSVLSEQTVNMQILDMYNREVAKPVNQTLQQPGSYHIYFDGNNITNGIYRYKIAGQSIIKEGYFPLLTVDVSKLVTTSPLIQSNSVGEFKINYSVLGIGKSFESQTPGSELKISNTIRFVLQKEGFQNLIFSATLDTTNTYEKTFTMIRNN